MDGFRNLVGRPECDGIIVDELKKARVAAVQVPRSSGDVPYSIEGRLGTLRLYRAAIRWVIVGPVCKSVHFRICADPVAGDIKLLRAETGAEYHIYSLVALRVFADIVRSAAQAAA